MMQQILSNPYFTLPLTLGIYLGAQWFYRRVHFPLFHPLLVTIGLLIGLLLTFSVPYESYEKGSHLLSFLLGPSVVAVGYLLYKESAHLKDRVVFILTSVFVGAVVGIVSVVAIAYLFGADRAIAASMQPKSVTTPIAMALAEQSGGIPALTAVVVVIAGIFGGLVSPPIFRLLKIESKIAKGLALGASAHGMGTLTAIQLGAVEGAIGGLAIGIMGFFTSILIPLADKIFFYFFG